jgi:hypothetical protein
MAVRPVFTTADLMSPVAATVGAALSAQLASQAFPENQHKRADYYLTTLTPTAGATAQEAFINGTNLFRFRLAQKSTAIIKAWAVYTCDTNANQFIAEITAGVTNAAGTAAILANATNVKMPTAATGTCVLTVSGQDLIFTCTGTSGDTNGRWSIRLLVNEITDIG